MCNVCEAEKALKLTRKGGYLSREVPGKFGYLLLRAKGTGSEKPATYQVKRLGDYWPSHWAKTFDLATDVGLWGFDVIWPVVDPRVRSYAMGRGPKPRITTERYRRIEWPKLTRSQRRASRYRFRRGRPGRRRR